MPAFQKPHKNLETKDALNGAALKREIAARTHVNVAVVDLILETFKEVATEEIVNKGAFNLAGLFAVTNYPTKETVTPKGVIPARNRLSVRLNDRVKKLWNGKLKANVTAFRSYRDLLEEYNVRTPASKPIEALLAEEPHVPFINPMLEDDDED